MNLAERTRLLSPPATSRMRVLANELKESGVHVINFAAGELDFDTSEPIRRAAKAAIDGKRNVYTPTLGIASLRRKVADRVSAQTGVPYESSEIGLTSGAKQALYNAAMVLLNPGDEVIIPAPYWVTFPTQVEICGAKPVFVETRDDRYRLRASRVFAALSARTRAIIINSPNNPTGAVYDRDELTKIAGLALDHGIWIVFDECYSSLVRDGHEHVNIVSLLPEVKAQTVIVNSFSKSHAMTGWRLGYAAAPKAVIKAMENLQGHTTSNPNSVTQYAVDAALDDDDGSFIDAVNRRLQRRLRLASDLVAGMPGIRMAPAEGAFYLFLDVAGMYGKAIGGETIRDVDHLSELLLSKANVAVVPGSAFGDASGIRLSYAIAEQDVVNGLERMAAFFEALQ